jgi:hypothetical protein
LLKFDLKDWIARIQQNFIHAGYSDLNQLEGFKGAKVAGNFEREYWVEFETAEQETLFALRFG